MSAITLSAGVRALFEGKNFAHVATTMKDGAPQVTVVWVGIEGNNILVNTAEGRVKPRNVRRDPRVAVSICDQEDPYRAAAVQGTVIEMRHEGAEEHIDALALKYTGDHYKNLRPGEQRVIMVIEPDHVATMGID